MNARYLALTGLPTAGEWGGADPFESADGKFVYYDKPVVPGIWKIPVAGGEETRVLDRAGPNVWALTAQGICYFERTTAPALNCYNFNTRKVLLLREFSKDTRINWNNTSVAVSPDGRWILYTQFDQSGSNLTLVENFR
jgi:hypothetical protein